MQLKIQRTALKNALAVVARTTGTKLINPVLGCVLMTAKGNKLTLYTTNNEAATKVTIREDITVKQEGGCAVPVTLLANIVSCIPGAFKEIELEFDPASKQLEILYAQNVYHVAGFEPESFKNHALEFETHLNIPVSGSRLKTILDNAVTACETKNESRPSLQGVKMFLSGNTLEVVATDSRRMCVCRTQLVIPEDHDGFDVVVPGKMVKTLISHLSDAGDVMLCVDKNSTMIAIAETDTVVYARLMEVEYVNYRDFIPGDREKYVKANTAELIALFNGCLPIAAQNGNLVSFAVNAEGIVVSATSAETGDANLKLFCETAGKTKEIAVNCNFMVEALRLAEYYQVTMSFGDKITDPIHIKPVPKEDSTQTSEAGEDGKRNDLIDYDFDWVVMPIRQS